MQLLERRWGRRALFGVLYASEGAPIGYIWWALPTKLKDAGVPVEEVTALTAMVTVPWALKFLWAPLVDTLRGPRWGLRAWIVASQLLMGLALLPLLLSEAPFATDKLGLLSALLVGHALFASTQDVSIDALAIERVGIAAHARAFVPAPIPRSGGLVREEEARKQKPSGVARFDRVLART